MRRLPVQRIVVQVRRAVVDLHYDVSPYYATSLAATRHRSHTSRRLHGHRGIVPLPWLAAGGFETARKDYASPPWASRQRSPHRITFRLHASAALRQRDASPHGVLPSGDCAPPPSTSRRTPRTRRCRGGAMR